MRIGAIELNEPLPQLQQPHALAILRPWVDVGVVGSLALLYLEERLHAKPLGQLARPGDFFDFTRYRPVLHTREGQRQIAVPNTVLSYAQRPEAPDFLFLHLMEPHYHGEDYVDSILGVLDKLAVKRYFLMGAMYDVVPHTKPLLVTGSSTGGEMEVVLKGVDVRPSSYEGPTTIVAQVSQEAPKHAMDAAHLIVHLPQYTQLEEDFSGQLCLLRILCSLYGFPFDLQELEQKAQHQYEEISRAVESNAQAKDMVRQLERLYEARTKLEESGGEAVRLSPEVERFLREINKRFGQN